MQKLTTRLKEKLNRSMPATRDAELGNRIEAFETFGSIIVDYGGEHTNTMVLSQDIPMNPIVVVGVTSADASVDLILPVDAEKIFIIENGSGQTVTVKAEGQAGVAVTNGSTGIVKSNGTDFVSFTISNEVTLAGAQTLTNKTLTAPVITSPSILEASTTHDYGVAHADWAVSAVEAKTGILIAIGTADGTVSVIATPTAGKIFTVVNTCGQALTIKATGQTGVTIASTKTAIVRGTGTDFVRVSSDA